MAAGLPRLSPTLKSWLRFLILVVVVLVVVLGSLYAILRVWPPLVVIITGSMQHSDNTSYLGVIDTGDIVFVQGALLAQDLVTYVEGRAQGHRTYEDYGDVILYQRPGDLPIIHRPLFRLLWNDTAQGLDIPSLLALQRGQDWDLNRSTTPLGLRAGAVVILHNVTFKNLSISFPIGQFINQAVAPRCTTTNPCYVTMGDNAAPTYDGALIRHSWVVGRARGELPWLGLLNLVLGGTYLIGDSRVPANSWTSLGVVFLVLIGALVGWEVVRWKRGPRRRASPGSDEGGLGSVVSVLEERWKQRQEGKEEPGEGAESGEPPHPDPEDPDPPG